MKKSASILEYYAKRTLPWLLLVIAVMAAAQLGTVKLVLSNAPSARISETIIDIAFKLCLSLIHI